MPTSQTPQILTLIDELQKCVEALNTSSDLDELRALVHRPGWTTIAEQSFVITTLEALIEHLRMASNLRTGLVAVSKQVGSRRPAE